MRADIKIKFERSFAKNWKAGEIVEARPLDNLDNGEILVDNKAVINVNQLFQYAIILPEQKVGGQYEQIQRASNSI